MSMYNARNNINRLLGWGRGGDYEGLSNKSEVGRPLIFYGLQALITFIKLCVFTLYEAFLIGSWHWIIMLVASVLSLAELDEDGARIEFKFPVHNEFFVYSFFSGVFSVVMLLLGATIWPHYSIQEGRMLAGYQKIHSLGPIFIWLRFILMVFPLALVKPTKVLEWVAMIESIMPRFRSTNFQTIDPKHVQTPIGILETKDLPAPVVPPYPMLPIEEEDDEVEYVISDNTSDITVVNV
jgi:hypothetical protein